MKVLVFGRDPGGANALIPVVKALEAAASDHLDLTGQDWALEMFSRQGLDARPIAGIADPSALVKEVDVLLTATSWPPDAELRLWQAAEYARVPSLALLDFWSNYRLRCTALEGHTVWPTRIAAMDSLAADEMYAEGIPAERIIVTGQPFLEMRAAELQAKVHRYGPAEPGRILFVSQPLSTYPDGNRRGYDEFSVAELVMRALDGLQYESGEPLRLVIRPHPKDDAARWQKVIDRVGPLITCELEAEGDADRAIFRSCVVLGISSMMLIEALLAGRSIISVQPGLTDPDRFPGSRMGCCPRVGDGDSLKKSIADALENGVPEQTETFSRCHKGATHRVVQALRELGVSHR